MKRALSVVLVSIFTALVLSTPLVLTKPAHAQTREGFTTIKIDTIADSLKSTYLYTEALKLINIEQDTTQALKTLEQILTQEPNYAPALYQMGVILTSRNDARGSDYARRAFAIDSTNKWYAQQLGMSLLMSYKYEEALSLYRKLLKLEPNNPDNYRITAILYDNKGMPMAAIAHLDSADMRFGQLQPLAELKRNLLLKTRQFDRAVDEAKTMVDIAPYEQENHVVLASLYAAIGKDSLARDSYSTAFAIDSTDVGTLTSMAEYYENRRDYAALLSTTNYLMQSSQIDLQSKVSRFLSLTSDVNFYREYLFMIDNIALTIIINHPKEPKAVELYADHLITTGQLERALEFYKLHTTDSPPRAEYFKSVIDIENYLQRPDSSALYINKALELFPEDIDLHLRKGYSLSAQKRHTEAIESYTRTLDIAKGDSTLSVIWGLIGDTWQQEAITSNSDDHEASLILENIDQHKDAKRLMKRCYKAYDKSLEYNPNNIVVLNNYAYFLTLQMHDLERAVNMASHAVELSDNNPTYMDTMAWALFKSGQNQKAKEIMQQAVSLDGQKNPELLLHYGDILNAMGERFMAEVYWKRALERGYNQDAVASRFEEKQETSTSDEK